MTRSTASFFSWNQSLNLECDFKNVCYLQYVFSPLVFWCLLRSKDGLRLIQPDMAVLRFACITCMLSTSRIYFVAFSFSFSFLRGGGVLLVFVVLFFSFLFVGFFLFLSFFCFLLSCLFVYFCLLTVLYRWYVHVYNHTICNGSSGLLQ